MQRVVLGGYAGGLCCSRAVELTEVKSEVFWSQHTHKSLDLESVLPGRSTFQQALPASINKHFGAHKSWKLNGGRSKDFLERMSWILSSSPQHSSSHRCCTTGQDVVRNIALRTQIQAPQEPGPGLGRLKLLTMYSGLCCQAGGGKMIWFYLCLELIHLIFPKIWHYAWRINGESNKNQTLTHHITVSEKNFSGTRWNSYKHKIIQL